MVPRVNPHVVIDYYFLFPLEMISLFSFEKMTNGNEDVGSNKMKKKQERGE